MSNEQARPGPGDESEPERPATPPPGGEGGGPGAPPPGDPYGGGPFGGGPYGDAYGARDPLAGMPPLAGLWRRLFARIIDALLIGIPVSLVLWPLGDGFDDGREDGGWFAGRAIVLLVYFVYDGYLLSTRGQTVGKLLMKIRVGMLEDGSVPRGSPGWTRAAVYWLPQLVPFLGGLFLLVNVLFCTWDKPYRQCLHDKAARTVVVSTE